MKRKLLASLLSMIPISTFADNQAIINANNEASINFLYSHQNITYSNNPNDLHLYNINGNSTGADVGISKTFSQIYTAIHLSANSGTFSYNNPALNLSKATLFTQAINGRLGYNIFFKDRYAITPYFTLGYQYWQLDTGGSPRAGFLINGTTQIFSNDQCRYRVLNQWAVTPSWVLSSDITLGWNDHPWTYVNMRPTMKRSFINELI